MKPVLSSYFFDYLFVTAQKQQLGSAALVFYAGICSECSGKTDYFCLCNYFLRQFAENAVYPD